MPQQWNLDGIDIDAIQQIAANIPRRKQKHLAMETGYIKTLNLEKGYGFISTPACGKDVFFHFSSLHESLPFDETLQERRVVFDVEQSDKGPRAINVRDAN